MYKIYVGKNKRKAKQITFEKLLCMELEKSGFKLENDCFSDSSLSWVGIIQQSKDNSEITVNICFNDGIIYSVNVYEAKIITILDHDNAKKLI